MLDGGQICVKYFQSYKVSLTAAVLMLFFFNLTAIDVNVNGGA